MELFKVGFDGGEGIDQTGGGKHGDFPGRSRQARGKKERGEKQQAFHGTSPSTSVLLFLAERGAQEKAGPHTIPNALPGAIPAGK